MLSRDTMNAGIRLILAAIMLYYAAFMLGFLQGNLIVAKYGGAFADHQLWAWAYGLAAFSSFVAIIREDTGLLLRLALVVNAIVTVAWVFVRSIIVCITHQDINASFNALAWLVVIMVLAYVQGRANPSKAIVVSRLQALWREKGGQNAAMVNNLTGDGRDSDQPRNGGSDGAGGVGQSES